MRIVSGSLKGRRLKVFGGSQIRPTSERIRESLFNVIATSVTGCAALDLFAGTGAVGIEALSRGAKTVTLVEKDRTLAKNLASLCRQLEIVERATILNLDAMEAVRLLNDQQAKYDMIFLDPPYKSDWIEVLFGKDFFFNLVAPEGIIVVERANSGNHLTGFKHSRIQTVFSRIYGSSALQMFKLKSFRGCIQDGD